MTSGTRRAGGSSAECAPGELSPVDLAAMGDSSNDHESSAIIDGVDDAVITDTYAVVVTTCELGSAGWALISCESLDCAADTFSERTMQPVVRTRRLPPKTDLVAAGRRARYPRTSAQDTVSSRSSRACSAARLSSRYSSRSRSSA